MQNADELIVEIGARHGFDGELCRSLRLSRDGRMGAGADGLALEAAETRIARAPEADFVAALDAGSHGAGGLLSFWHGLRLMAQGRYHEAADSFEKAGNGPHPLPQSQVAPFVTILRKKAPRPAPLSFTVAAPSSATTEPERDWAPRKALAEPGPLAAMPFQADYSLHKAFIPHLDWDERRSGPVEEAVGALNRLLLGLESDLTLKRLSLSRATELVTGPISALADLLKAGHPDDRAFTAFAERFRKEVMWMAIQDLAYYERRNSYQTVLRDPDELTRYNELAFRGFLEFDLTPAELQDIRRRVKPYLDEVEARYARGETSREQLAINQIDPQTMSHVCRIFQDRGINKAVSDVRHEVAEATGMAVELSVHDADWWRSRYEDAGVGTNACAYLHNDESRDVYKAIVYLDDVGEDSGPFSILPATYAQERPRFAWCAARATGTALENREIRAGMPDVDESRGVFTSKAARRLFGMLPPCLRLSSHFGYDVPDGSPMAASLLSMERRILAPAGHVVAFDGSRLVHRGGQVGRGVRRALQVVFNVEKRNGLDLYARLYAPRGS